MVEENDMTQDNELRCAGTGTWAASG